RRRRHRSYPRAPGRHGDCCAWRRPHRANERNLGRRAVSARPILLDTHAAIWLPDKGRLSDAAEDALQEAQRDGLEVFLSPISAWELGMLTAHGKIALPTAPMSWLEALVESGLLWAPLSPEVLVGSSFLPGQLHGDPADRLLAATARTFDFRLMTR